MELAYTTSDLYDLPDLSPASWADLVERYIHKHTHCVSFPFSRFSDYPELVSDYRYNIYGQTSSHDRSCDQVCLKETICAVSNILSSERTKCLSGPAH